jgi:hypothetical protein
VRRAAFTAVLAAALVGCTSAEPENPYPSIDDLPECDPARPSFECLQKLFLPLRETEWPFDRDRVFGAYVKGASFQVAPGYNLTALHVLDGVAGMQGLVPDCYAAAFEYAAPGTTIERANCGSFLLLGGHPRSAQCKLEQISLLVCVDLVPVAETFDIGLVASAPTPTRLEVRDDIQVGEDVFMVGNPGFLFSALTSDQTAWFDARYPLVSSGTVLALDGRGMVISNLGFQGNSGGPVLDRSGHAVGVAYTKISDPRALGTPTDPAFAGHRTVAVRIDSAMKARIQLGP